MRARWCCAQPTLTSTPSWERLSKPRGSRPMPRAPSARRCGWHPGIPTTTSTSASRSAGRGELLSEAGRLGEAVEAFREAVRVKPHRVGSYRGLGRVLLVLGLDADAEATYREALRFRPGDAQSHFNLWAALEKQGKHAECEAAYREAIRIKPDLALAHARL